MPDSDNFSLPLLVLVLFPFCAGLLWLLLNLAKKSSPDQISKYFPDLEPLRYKRRLRPLPLPRFLRPLKKARRLKGPWLLFTTLMALFLVLAYFDGHFRRGDSINCLAPYIIDGDTLDCAGTRIRLASIDAPEMPGHCRYGRDCTQGDPYAARAHLHSLTRGLIACTPLSTDHYGRTVARCRAGDTDLSCAMVNAGLAVERYGLLLCPAD